MGREIRLVPPNWDHPVIIRRNGNEGPQPMLRGDFQTAAKEWKEGLAKWERGERDDYVSEEYKHLEYWEYAGGPPDRECYCPWKPEEATWFQVWETVSEGTPVSPPFATKEELVDYLVANGDFWDQSRRAEGRTTMKCDPWSRADAARFVHGSGWMPSMTVTTSAEGTEINSRPVM